MINGLLFKSLCNGVHPKNEVFPGRTFEKFGIQSFSFLREAVDGAIFQAIDPSMQPAPQHINGSYNGSTWGFSIEY